MDEPDKPALFAEQAGKARILIGLVQGIALYLLYEASEAKAWPATNIQLFATLVTCTVLSPLVLTSGLTQLRPARLIAWTAIVTLVCALTAIYDIGRDVPLTVPRRTPSFQIGFVLLLSLFIAHSLVIAGTGSRHLVAPYPNYFSASWKIGLQTAMAVLFAIAMWLVLWFGAQLFALIKIELLTKLLQTSWFNIPVTALALNCAIHVTDVRDGMVRGLRTLACNLLAWLLPLMTLLAAAFVLVLPFTGVELLWSTRHAAQILLGGAAGLIILINTAYQDGRMYGEGTPPRIFAWSIRVACAVIVVLVPLAAYGLALRINQYGWTPDRVFAAACTIVAASYAVGYAYAAVRGPALRPIQLTNVVTSGLIVAILIALISPVADPARISVVDQMARLKSGKADPSTFDYRFLRFEAGRFGFAALEELKQSQSAVVAQKANEALAETSRYGSQIVTLSADERAANIRIAQPAGASLPRAFLETDWTRSELRGFIAPCLHSRARCDGLLIAVDGGARQDIVLLPSPSGQASLYRADDAGVWSYAGTLAGSGCKSIRDALLAGRFESVSAMTRNITVNGHILPLTPRVDCALLTLPKP